jgi:glycosyltransferase involved in cell wall biosynthesis
MKRFLSRREEILDEHVHPLFVPEAIDVLLRSTRFPYLATCSLRSFGAAAIQHVEKAGSNGARLYHYRAGFGGKSVEVAKKRGMFALCDHSIAHPATVEALVRNAGHVTRPDEERNLSPFWRHILQDIRQADAVLVNSDFVECTFRIAEKSCPPIHVIYLGVDDSFLKLIPPRTNTANELRMLFAGSFEKRKGVESLLAALKNLHNFPWKLEIAGDLGNDAGRELAECAKDPRITYIGLLSRKELAQAMSRADVFVFPSLAEGSARVVFEAMACGCYVITTPNSGSIVRDGIHGKIIMPGDNESLSRAIEYAHSNRDEIAEIGSKSAFLVREQYTQRIYGEKLSDLYAEILAR